MMDVYFDIYFFKEDTISQIQIESLIKRFLDQYYQKYKKTSPVIGKSYPIDKNRFGIPIHIVVHENNYSEAYFNLDLGQFFKENGLCLFSISAHFVEQEVNHVCINY